MKCVVDNHTFPPELRIYDDFGLLRGKKEIESFISGIDEVFNANPNQLEILPMKRMVYRAIEVFKPEQITFEEK